MTLGSVALLVAVPWIAFALRPFVRTIRFLTFLALCTATFVATLIVPHEILIARHGDTTSLVLRDRNGLISGLGARRRSLPRTRTAVQRLIGSQARVFSLGRARGWSGANDRRRKTYGKERGIGQLAAGGKGYERSISLSRVGVQCYQSVVTYRKRQQREVGGSEAPFSRTSNSPDSRHLHELLVDTR